MEGLKFVFKKSVNAEIRRVICIGLFEHPLKVKVKKWNVYL